MRSLLTRFAFLGIAGALAISTIVPASAATRHRAPAPSLNDAPVAARASGYTQTGPVWRAPNECFSDEGYGRFTSCDAGGY